MNSRRVQMLVIGGVFLMLAAIVWFSSRHRIREKPITTSELRVASLAATLKMYAAENDGLPPQHELVMRLLNSPNGKSYVRNDRRIVREGKIIDHWKNEIRFHVRNASAVEVRSAGADGAFDNQDDLVRVAEL